MRANKRQSSALRKLALAGALAALCTHANAALVADGKFDMGEGYQLGVTFGIHDTHGTTNYGKLYFGSSGPNGTGDQFLYIQMPIGYVDNVYGTPANDDATGWFNGHTFNELLSGDYLKLGWGGTDPAPWGGTNEARANEVKLDYLAGCTDDCGPSGYKSGGVGSAGTNGAGTSGWQGITGSDGSVVTGSAAAIKEVATSLEYNLNSVIGGTGANTNSPLANPNWIKEVGYEVQFAAGTFNASDWLNKSKAPGLITLYDPGVSPSKKTFKDYTPPTCTYGCGPLPEPGTNWLLGIGALSMLWFARRRRDAVTPNALRRLFSS